MKKNLLFDIESPDSVLAWFRQFGSMDEKYLLQHLERFVKTKEFALSPSQDQPLSILNIGSHWLHNASIYANEGHKLHCADPDMCNHPYVIKAAAAMGASLYNVNELQFGDGINDFSESSIDIVLFCEIIEHITFNPILMWKSIYRVLKPGGKVIITTPNINYWQRKIKNLGDVIKGNGIGIRVSEIMGGGTYSHHWKEFSLNELVEYFRLLSNDFLITKKAFSSFGHHSKPPSDLPFNISDEELNNNILLEVTLMQKSNDIKIEPPWLPRRLSN